MTYFQVESVKIETDVDEDVKEEEESVMNENNYAVTVKHLRKVYKGEGCRGTFKLNLQVEKPS